MKLLKNKDIKDYLKNKDYFVEMSKLIRIDNNNQKRMMVLDLNKMPSHIREIFVMNKIDGDKDD